MSASPIQVLLVEDNPGDARLIREHFADAGAASITVETVQTLASAVQRCARPGVDAVLLDLGLPDCVGLDTLKAVRACAPELPVLVLTGLDDEKTAVQAVLAGAQDYLLKGEIGGAVISRALRYAIARKRVDTYREMGLEILKSLNAPGELPDSIRRVIATLKTRAGFDAVGIRLQDGEDFPYYSQDGFSEEFLRTENTLVERAAEGGVSRDRGGSVRLECTCGLVLSGTTVPGHPLFTRAGSFWTNDSFPLLDLPAGQDPRFHPRNQCMLQGYASLALVPIRDKDRIVGLLHLSDRRKGRFTLETVELLEGMALHIGEALMRKRAEEKLKLNEARLAAAQAVAKIGSWETDLLNLKVVWSEETYRIFEVDPASFQTTHRNFMDLVHPEDRAKVEAAFAGLFHKHALNVIEHRIVTPRGLVKVVEEHWRILHDEQGQPVLAMGTCQDVTERKQVEAELQKMLNLKSVGTLAGGIAHDFNNILLGLFGNISIAMDDLSKDHPCYAPLAEAEKSMTRAVRLTKQLLTFAKGGEPVKENVSLGAVIEEVARFDLTGSNVSLVCRQAEDLWPAQADRGQLQQVISNLVINARQAMPKGGHLYITLENEELAAEAVAGLPPGRYAKVIVRDEGTGIDPALLDQIFDPYFTTKQTGNGLGLATVWSIITKHGGHIGVVSEPGKGTAFTFYLPASESPQPAALAPPAAESLVPSQSRPAAILVMDDEEMVCTLAARMLTRCGYTVSTARDGQEAIAMYGQSLKAGTPFDAVIMDLTIPGGIGGKEAVKELLALDPNVRVVVSSGYADDPIMANFAEFGFTGTVAKPYTQSELRDEVARVLA